LNKIIHTSGKRKRAIARATLKPGTGLVKINRKKLNVYNPKMARLKLKEPLILAGNIANEVNININVKGGGVISQTEAARLAMSRALVKYNKKLEKIFLSYDRHLLIADVRRKETCKPNTSKARAKRQKSYR
tara:strand:- start:381 stop:776 length:396 start_codon:yes stop_codon:yes gene_type:complete